MYLGSCRTFGARTRIAMFPFFYLPWSDGRAQTGKWGRHTIETGVKEQYHVAESDPSPRPHLGSLNDGRPATHRDAALSHLRRRGSVASRQSLGTLETLVRKELAPGQPIRPVSIPLDHSDRRVFPAAKQATRGTRRSGKGPVRGQSDRVETALRNTASRKRGDATK
jgi:hypothetical protein